jgi:hypothetical protein
MAIRFPLMAIAGLLLLAALWAGVVRVGWELSPVVANLPVNHGPLMIVGFLGTLISLERAVALGLKWPYGAPLFSALAAFVLFIESLSQLAPAAAALGSLFLIAIFTFLYGQQASISMATMGVGAALWFAGNVLWYLEYPFNRIVPCWVGFLALTIAGERLELARFLILSTWDRGKFILACGLIVCGLIVSLFKHAIGVWIDGVGFVALALWLLRYDMAWRTIQQSGLSRFMGICLLSGYLWLVIGGIFWMAFYEFFIPGPRYDAMLHSILVGFVFSMIFAHGPVILPLIAGVTIPFQRLFYGHLILLHLSLLLRISGDLVQSPALQRWGGLINALAIVFFLTNNLRAVKRGAASP